MTTVTTEAKTKPRAAWSRAEFYRQCRLWHGYLSAVSFLALIFFCATGIMMNHPDWFRSPGEPSVEHHVTLAPSELAALRVSSAPQAELVELLGGKVTLRGAYSPREGEGWVEGNDLHVKLRSARGWSDIHADRATGKVDVEVASNSVVTMLNGLHKAQAAAPWRLLIDVVAIIMISVSLVGFILFLSLRMRLRSSLVLIAGSLLAVLGLFFATVR